MSLSVRSSTETILVLKNAERSMVTGAEYLGCSPLAKMWARRSVMLGTLLLCWSRLSRWMFAGKGCLRALKGCGCVVFQFFFLFGMRHVVFVFECVCACVCANVYAFEHIFCVALRSCWNVSLCLVETWHSPSRHLIREGSGAWRRGTVENGGVACKLILQRSVQL